MTTTATAPSVSTGPSGDERSDPDRLVQAALTALLMVPLVIALVSLHRARWYPILDMAMTELRVREVGSSHTPLVGLPGRIGVFGAERGSHPGPLSFWLIAPTYRLFGASAWAMEVGAVVLHGIATGISLWLARRRGGMVLMAGVALVLALVMRSYGPEVLTQPWNPYLPVSWWFVVLLACWSILCGDLVALPIAVFAASVCAQTHLPYAPLTGGFAVLVAFGLFAAARDPERRPRVLRWLAGSVLLAAVLWLPVLLDQLTAQPGNVTLLVDYFRNPPESPVGLRRGVEMVLLHLDPWRFVSGQGPDTGSLAGASSAPTGSYLPGAAALVAWVASAVVAWRRRGHGAEAMTLVRLHAVVGVSLLLAAYSISRIFGLLWYYLMLWAFAITGLTLLAVAWTVVAVLMDRRAAGPVAAARDDRRTVLARPRLAAVAGLAVLALVSTTAFGVTAASVHQPAESLSREMALITPQIIGALDDGSVPLRGRDERYLVTWEDSVNIGAEGIALVNELARSGFDVGVTKPWSVTTQRFRAREPGEASSRVHLASGDGPVAAWRARSDVVEIASVDTRTTAERKAFDQVRLRVVDRLRSEGLDEVAGLVDSNLFLAAIDERLSEADHRDLGRLLDLGQPSAAFVGAADIPG